MTLRTSIEAPLYHAVGREFSWVTHTHVRSFGAAVAGFLRVSCGRSYDRKMRTPDRRRRRSPKAAEAIRLQLAAARKAAGIDSLVLADEAGLCIAAAGAGWPHEEIAAYAAMVGTK